MAVLTGDTDRGDKPLTVNFDASGSHDNDKIDTISSYTFNFGDGGDVTQSSPQISHTFNNTGEFAVRLVVTDSRGKVSANTAQFVVEVESAEVTPTPTPTPTTTPTPTGVFGRCRSRKGKYLPIIRKPRRICDRRGFLMRRSQRKSSSAANAPLHPRPARAASAAPPRSP